MGEQVQSPELEELERVLASPEFRSSRRGQRMLRYLVEHALNGDPERLKERSVGFELFGRDPDYDTARDSIVRVAANDVRKRLADYYHREYQSPAIPALRIVLPTGSYVPTFQKAEPAAAEQVLPTPETREFSAPSAVPVRAPRSSWWRTAAGCFVCLLVLGGAAWWLRPTAHPAGASGEPGPNTDLLWKQVFGNGRPTCMVLSDSNLTMLEEMIGRNVTAQEYVQKRFPEMVEAQLRDPVQKDFAELLMRPPSTSMADASAARAFGDLNGRHSIATDLIFARDFSTSYFDSHNVVMLGSLRSNPWVGLFESQLNFQTGNSERPVLIWFDNKSPRPRENARYAGIWNREGYCRVAFLSNGKRAGNVLILSGTSLSTTAAGTEFVTNEEWLRKFRAMLGPAAQERFPHFEVLLRVHLVASMAVKFEIAGWRTYPQ